MNVKLSHFTCLKSDDLAIFTIDIFGAWNVNSEDG